MDEIFEVVERTKPLFLCFVEDSYRSARRRKVLQNIATLTKMQLDERRHFIISACSSSKIWESAQLKRLLAKSPCATSKECQIISSSDDVIDAAESSSYGDLDEEMAKGMIAQCRQDNRISSYGEIYLNACSEEALLLQSMMMFLANHLMIKW